MTTRVDIDVYAGGLQIHLRERGFDRRTETFERKKQVMAYLRGLKAANALGYTDFRLGHAPEWLNAWRVLPLIEQEQGGVAA